MKEVYRIVTKPVSGIVSSLISSGLAWGYMETFFVKAGIVISFLIGVLTLIEKVISFYQRSTKE